MNLLEEILREAIIEYDDKVPSCFHITKHAEEEIYFFSKQLECDMDTALEILLRYASIDCINIFEKLGVKFDPSKSY